MKKHCDLDKVCFRVMTSSPEKGTLNVHAGCLGHRRRRRRVYCPVRGLNILKADRCSCCIPCHTDVVEDLVRCVTAPATKAAFYWVNVPYFFLISVYYLPVLLLHFPVFVVVSFVLTVFYFYRLLLLNFSVSSYVYFPPRFPLFLFSFFFQFSSFFYDFLFISRSLFSESLMLQHKKAICGSTWDQKLNCTSFASSSVSEAMGSCNYNHPCWLFESHCMQTSLLVASC